MTDNQIKVGSYVTDESQGWRHHRNVFEVTGFSFDRAIVRHVGVVKPGGQLDTSGYHGVTHRDKANLRLWE